MPHDRSQTVELYLLRHAHAGDPEKWSGDDDERPLSEKGRLQAERLGLFLADVGFEPDLIVSSPKVRAAETARLVATPLGLPVVIEAAVGGPLDLERLESLLAGFGNPRRPMLVGHDPDFSALAADLAGAPELSMRKGALARIDSDRPLVAGSGILRWLIPPDVFGNLDRQE